MSDKHPKDCLINFKVSKTKRDEYKHMERKELIALCDERGILSAKRTPIGRNQKKAYYIGRLVEWDEAQALPDDEIDE